MFAVMVVGISDGVAKAFFYGTLNTVDTLMTFLAFLSLFLYSYRKKLLKKIFWQVFFFIFISFDIAYNVSDVYYDVFIHPIRESSALLRILFVFLVSVLPVYIALGLYAFKFMSEDAN
jgi:hypothetical protein